MTKDYVLPLRPTELRSLTREAQLTVLESWFRDRFEDPAFNTNYDSEDGEYKYWNGGPFEASDELRSEFEGIVPDDVIDELVEKLNGESAEWAPVPSGEFFIDDDYWDDATDPNLRADVRGTFQSALDTIEKLLQLPIDRELSEPLWRLLYANVVSALETYLADIFINEILQDELKLRKFFESYPGYQKRTIRYSELFTRADNARKEATRELVGLLWHRLPSVRQMYRSTLGITFEIKDLVRAIPIRHDIVHRNGRDNDGKPVAVNAEAVQLLIASARNLAKEVEAGLDATSEVVDPGF